MSRIKASISRGGIGKILRDRETFSVTRPYGSEDRRVPAKLSDPTGTFLMPSLPGGALEA